MSSREDDNGFLIVVSMKALLIGLGRIMFLSFSFRICVLVMLAGNDVDSHDIQPRKTCTNPPYRYLFFITQSLQIGRKCGVSIRRQCGKVSLLMFFKLILKFQIEALLFTIVLIFDLFSILPPILLLCPHKGLHT